MKEELRTSQNCSENLTNASGKRYGEWLSKRNLKEATTGLLNLTSSLRVIVN
jgi:hypothetical protein